MTRAEELIAAAVKAHELTLEGRLHPERAAECDAAANVYRANIRTLTGDIAGRRDRLRGLMNRGEH